MTDVEALRLQITGDSQSAEQSINSLIATLGRLETATKGGCGLGSLSNSLQRISTAVNGMSGSGQKLTDLANGLSAISKVGQTKISTNIANQITAINTAIRDSATVDYSSITRLSTALQPLTSLGKGGLGTLISQLKNLPTVAAELNKVDITSFTAKINQLAAAMRPLANEMQKVANGFSAFPAKIQKFMASSAKVPTTNIASALSFVRLAAKMKIAIFAVQRIGRVVASWINESNRYIEDTNLFTVAMGEYAESAKEYANEVSEVMGIDPAEWMRNQGVFMTLASGFGVATDRAAKMSEQLTQLGYDISSFYNISVSDAMTKLQSGLSGELEPLRRIGYDLSQAKLQATAASLGIDKLVSSMTQAEKAELRYYAIMTQVTQVQGDMARTLAAPANQLRVLKSQATMAARALGDLFIPMLNAIIPYAIAALKVITMLAQAIASLFGLTLKVDFSGVGEAGENAGGAIGDIPDDLEDAVGSANKLKKILLGIDELNVLPDTSTGGGGGGTGGVGGGGFDFELPEYDFLENAVTTKVGEIVDKIKEWLGISEEIGSWAEFFETRLGRILSLVGLIGAAIALWKLSNKFLTALNTLSKLMMTPTQSIVLGITLAVTGFTLAFTGLKSAIENGLDGLNFAEIVGGGLLGGGGAAILGSKIATWISTAFAGSAVDLAITQAGINLGVGTAGAAGAAIAGAFAGVIVGIPAYFVGVYDAIKNGIDWLSGLLVGAGATAAGAGIGAIIGMIGGPIGAGIGALIGLAVGLLTDFGIWLWQNFEKVEEWFSGLTTWGKVIAGAIGVVVTVAGGAVTWIAALIAGVIALVKNWESVTTWFTGVCTAIGQFFADLWADIQSIWNVVATWFDANVIQPLLPIFTALWEGISSLASICWGNIVDRFKPAVDWFSQLFSNIFQTISDVFHNIGVIASGCWEIIKALWNAAPGFFSNMWNGIKTTATNLWNSIKTGATNAWNGIKTVLSPFTNWINTNIVQPASTLLSNLWSGFLTGAKNAWEGTKQVFSAVATFFYNTFHGAWSGIVKIFSVAGSIFVDIKNGIVSAFKKIVNGIIGGLNKVISIPFKGINTALSTIRNISIMGLTPFAGLKSISVPSIPYLASGGIVDAGQLFVAREAGPELVMNAGRKTAVMNNDQIVESVSQGVYRAFTQAMGENSGSRVVEAKVNDKVLFEVIVNRNRQETMRTGYSPLLGGV